MSIYANFFIRINDIFVPIASLSKNSTLGSIFITKGPWGKVRPITKEELVDVMNKIKNEQDLFNKKISEIEKERDYIVGICDSISEKIEVIERYKEEINDYKEGIEEHKCEVHTLAMYYQLTNEIEFAEQDKLPFKADSTKYLYYGIEISHPTLEDIEIGCVK